MGWIGCVHCEKFNYKFFRTKSVQSGPPGRFSHSFSYRNRNFKNALNMCFGSNGMDWVRPLRKIQLQVFSYQKCPERPSRPIFAQFFVLEPKLQKRAKHEFWVKRDGLGASIAKNSTASFFVPKVSRAALPAHFGIVFHSGTETPKTR